MDSNNKILSYWDTLPEEIQHIILKMVGGLEHREKMQHIVDDLEWFRQVNEDLCTEMRRVDLDHEVEDDHMDWDTIDQLYDIQGDIPPYNAGVHLSLFWGL